MLYQEHNLFSHLNVRDNIAIGINPNLKLTAEQRARLHETAEKTGLADLLDRLPEPLSLDWGGGLIRVALPAGETPDLTGTRAIATRLTGATPLSLPPMAPAVAALNDGLRARFDPRGLFAGAV